jgi:hypothetical protein
VELPPGPVDVSIVCREMIAKSAFKKIPCQIPGVNAVASEYDSLVAKHPIHASEYVLFRVQIAYWKISGPALSPGHLYRIM